MRLAYVLIFAVFVTLAPVAQISAQQGSEAKQSVTTLTGVIDQQGDDYVLSGDESMKTNAVLRAQGFSQDNFARFVGNRVEVRGEMRTEGDRRILTVTSLDHLKRLGPSGSRK